MFSIVFLYAKIQPYLTFVPKSLKVENMKLSIILIFAIHFFEKCSTLPNPQNTFHFECQNDCSNDNFGNTNTNNYYGSSEHVKKNNKEAGAGKEPKGV